MFNFLVVFLRCLNFLFFTAVIQGSDSSVLNVSQVRGVVQNIEMATQVGQSGQDQVATLKDLENIFGSRMNVLSVDMNNFSTQELQSIAFGGYSLISNPFNRSASVSLNILKNLLPLDFEKMAQSGTNSICIGLFGSDANGNLLTTLSNRSFDTTIQALDHFKLYIFKSDGTLLGSAPLYIPLNKYYSNKQQAFITPIFASGTIAEQLQSNNNSKQNFAFSLNGQVVSGQSNSSYPYLVCIQNISGIDVPNRYLNMNELQVIFTKGTDEVSIPQINSYYQTLDFLEIIIGNSAFSFNQNSLNQSTDIGANGICADISQDTAPLITSGMQFIFVAIDDNGNVLSNIVQNQSKIDHYLLYIFDQNSNLIKGVYVNPLYTTPASSFNINQSENAITVRINGDTITKGQQYFYPISINLTYGSGIQLPPTSSLQNLITLKNGETLSNISYDLVTSKGSKVLSFANTNYFSTNWLDNISALLDMGQTVLINTKQSTYQDGKQALLGYELSFSIYGVGNTSTTGILVAQQAIMLPALLSNLTVNYQKDLSKAVDKLDLFNSLSSSSGSWIGIIPSGKLKPSSIVTSSSLKANAINYQLLKTFLDVHQITLYSTPVTSYVATQYINQKDGSITLPGWYDVTSKQYSYSGFNLQLEQMESGEGYFFVEDTANMNKGPFSGNSGVVGLLQSTLLLKELQQNIVSNGSCRMVLFGFDSNGNYIPDIIKTVPDYFNVYIFDQAGNNLLNSPISFKASDYVGLGKYQLNKNAQAPAIFFLNGIGISQIKKLTYPFDIKVSWKLQGGPVPKPKPKPTPKPAPKQTIPTIPASMVVQLDKTLFSFGYMVDIEGVKYLQEPPFSSDFINAINAKLEQGNSVVIHMITQDKNITAVAYSDEQQISQSSIALLSGEALTDKLYYANDSTKSFQLPITKISGHQGIWLEFKILKISYNNLVKLSLAGVQKILSLNASAVTSIVQDETQIPGWLTDCKSGFTLSLQQMNGGNGYAFIQDFWNKCSNNKFSGTSGIAGLSSQGKGYASLLAKMQKEIPVTLVLLAFDANNNYIEDIIKTAPSGFALFGYDQNGQILQGFPITFNASDYVGLGKYQIKSGAQGPAIFVFDGLRAASGLTKLQYPFALNINWKILPIAVQNISSHSLYSYLSGIIEQAWLSVSFKSDQSDHHLMINNYNVQAHQSISNVSKEYATAYMTNNFNPLSSSNLADGVILSFVSYRTKSYVYAQNIQGKFLGWAELINMNNQLPNSYIISGAYLSSVITVDTSKAFLITSSKSLTGLPTSIIVPSPITWPGFSG
ncbi:hypothetical protein HYV10_03840 [Candidatus Dependentiae bacterium]|nr:hypothetical protein [Candidatus Dependentiae bacterium]